jgi:hypothetical protein
MNDSEQGSRRLQAFVGEFQSIVQNARRDAMLGNIKAEFNTALLFLDLASIV